MHVAPGTLRVASTFAVLSRLEASKKAGMSLMKKLKLYDGEEVEEFSQRDVKELQDESPARGHGWHLAALRHQRAVARAGARRDGVRQSDRRACAHCATGWSSTPASAANAATSC